MLGYDRRDMTASPNLHELRRRSTREALRRAALASFARKGFSNVTVTELAREAGVTERTFFRHFPTKEAVLFQDYETQVEWLADALTKQSESESVFDAVLAGVASFPHDLEVVRQAASARTELISAERIAAHLQSGAGVVRRGDHRFHQGALRRHARHRSGGRGGRCHVGRGSRCGSGELGTQRLHGRPGWDHRDVCESRPVRSGTVVLSGIQLDRKKFHAGRPKRQPPPGRQVATDVLHRRRSRSARMFTLSHHLNSWTDELLALGGGLVPHRTGR